LNKLFYKSKLTAHEANQAHIDAAITIGSASITGKAEQPCIATKEKSHAGLYMQ